MSKTTLGERLRAARIDCGMTGHELSRRAGVSRSYATAIENGHRSQLRYETLTAFSRALGIRAEWLATGEGPMRREAGAA